MSLYNKYRPLSLDKIKGNENLIDSIQTLVAKEDPPHAFLLTGPTGCGKTTIARIIASMLDCNGGDLKEMDSAQFRGIDSVREIRSNSSYKALEGKNRGWLIDECHKLTPDAQNAALKILEDPPPHVFFFLCTTEPEKLIDTIKGRCIVIKVQTLNDAEMFKLLREVARAEKVKLEQEIFDQIIQDSFGHPRNALNILEQVLSASPEKRLNVAKQTALEQTESIALCQALLKDSPWKMVSNILKGLSGLEPENVRRHVLGYCSAVLLNKDNPKAAIIIEAMIPSVYYTGWPGLVFACYTIVKN
jgi:DNA polymerase-3 subunit gamma/tau